MEQDKNLKNIKIRSHLDSNTNHLYFSIVDVIGFFIKTSNPNNYWKVQKNRLKIKFPELVTNCNQLKMTSKDGKMYLTDVATSETILKIIEIISPLTTKELKIYFDNLEEKIIEKTKIEDPEFQLLIDGFEKDETIIIKAMIAGVKSEDLFITLGFSEIKISGKRRRNLRDGEILKEELSYGIFERTISLPHEINIEEVKFKIVHGMLILELPKINKNKKKILKINY